MYLRAVKFAFLVSCLLISFWYYRYTHSFYILSGLVDYQVIQRDSQDQGSVILSGRSQIDGIIEARINSAKKQGEWKKVGQSRNSLWFANITSIPVGGEYDIELRLEKYLIKVKHILVGDLWVLGGQSNMEGFGRLKNAEKETSLIHSLSFNDQWNIAKDPLHKSIQAVDPVHQAQSEFGKDMKMIWLHENLGAGLGLPFAKALLRVSSVPIGLIPCAKGGSTMQDWSPSLRNAAGNSLYGSLIRRVKQAGGRVRGILWFQGEADSTVEASKAYLGRLINFVKALRNDLRSPDLPFFYAQSSKIITGFGNSELQDNWNRVKFSQVELESLLPGVALVSTADLTLEDKAHLNTKSLKILGERFASLASQQVFEFSGSVGPRFEKASLSSDGKKVIVTYTKVNGSLEPQEGVRGFFFRTVNGEESDIIQEAKVDTQNSNKVVLKLKMKPARLSTLWYCFGFNPDCNLIDELNMAAPAQGPLLTISH